MSMVKSQATGISASQLARIDSQELSTTLGGMHNKRQNGPAAAINASKSGETSNSTNADLINQRIDLESLLGEFTDLLGKENWTKYAQVISLFILGKLSRKELCNELDLLFTPIDGSSTNISLSASADASKAPLRGRALLIRMHNHLLLGILANSLKDSPLMGNLSDGTWGFGNGSSLANKKRVNKHNSQIETYKKIVMSLPVNDRQRLKSITKEAGKRGFVLCSVLQARLNTIPKIPIVLNPETLKRVKSNNLKTPLEWSQDIMNGFNAPLATDSYSLPDTESLFLRMVGISREHGLVGTVDTGCVELLSLALDNYLKNILESAIDTVRYRQKKYSEYYDLGDNGFYEPVAEDGKVSPEKEAYAKKESMSLTNEDLYDCFTLFPNLVEPTGAFVSLPAVGLLNDDELVVTNSSIDDLADFSEDRPTFTPLDERNIGTREELNWLIKDILTED